MEGGAPNAFIFYFCLGIVHHHALVLGLDHDDKIPVPGREL